MEWTIPWVVWRPEFTLLCTNLTYCFESGRQGWIVFFSHLDGCTLISVLCWNKPSVYHYVVCRWYFMRTFSCNCCVWLRIVSVNSWINHLVSGVSCAKSKVHTNFFKLGACFVSDKVEMVIKRAQVSQIQPRLMVIKRAQIHKSNLVQWSSNEPPPLTLRVKDCQGRGNIFAFTTLNYCTISFRCLRQTRPQERRLPETRYVRDTRYDCRRRVNATTENEATYMERKRKGRI